MSYRSRRGMGAMDKGTAQDIRTGVDIASGIAQGIAQTIATASGGSSSSSTIPTDSTTYPTPAPAAPSTDWTPWIIGGGAVLVVGIGIMFLRPPKGVSANRRRRRR